MGKTSTLIYLFSNFDDNELIYTNKLDQDLTELEKVLDFIEKNTKKIPDRIVDQVIDFANNYS